MPAVTDLIPHRPPFLFVDEIVSENEEGLIARRVWRPEEDFYRGHYPGAPITPGVLLCEAVFQAAACYLALRAAAAGGKPGAGLPLIAKINEVRFRHPVYPGESVLIEVQRKDALGGFTMMGGVIRRSDGTRVMNVDFAVAWKTPESPEPPAA